MAQLLDVIHGAFWHRPTVVTTEPTAPASDSSWLEAEVEVSVATYQSYLILYYTFIALPLMAGLDKFLHLMANWETYVAPGLASVLHMSTSGVAVFAGVIELLIAAAVAIKPRIGSWVITVWMWLVGVNLLGVSGHYDLLFFTLALSAAGFAFTRLSAECN